MIRVTIAGEQKEIDENLSVDGLLEQESVEMPLYVSVSVNEEFIKREDFSVYRFHEGDIIEFLYFMGGGAV